MGNKFKKCAKAATLVAAYCAELVAVTYLGTRMAERWNEGEISTGRYAVESSALAIGTIAAGLPITFFGIEAVEDAVEEFTSSDYDELEFTEE